MRNSCSRAATRPRVGRGWCRPCSSPTAIWSDDIDAVRDLVTANPHLIHEHALIRTDSNWGPPMTYAANLGRDRIIRMLHELGATDLESAVGRAALQGQVETAKMLHEMAGQPAAPGRCARRAGLHAERRRHGVPARHAARASSMTTASAWRRWTWCSRPTAAIQPRSTPSSRCTCSTASSFPIRR